MILYIYIAIGGALGAMLRHSVNVIMGRLWLGNLPLATLSVNVIGSFIMGAFIAFLAKTIPHSLELKAMVAIGFLGAFTTFSAFSLDAVNLYEKQLYGILILYILFSVFLSIFALFFGLYLGRSI